MQDERTYRLEHAPLRQLLLHYAVPAVVGTSVAALYNLVDRIFIGQMAGAYAMAGLALTFPILIFLQAFGMLVGVGSATRISIYLGQKRNGAAKEILGTAIILTALFSLTTAALSLYFLDELLLLFGGSEQTIPFARSYLLVTIPGNIFSVLSMGYNAMMRASGYPRKAMYTMLIGAVLNTLLDYFFVYRWGWGISGAAWATVISMFASACFVMSHFLSKDSLVHFEGRYIKLSPAKAKDIITIGLSPFAVQILGTLSSILINRRFVAYATTTHESDMAIGALGLINSYVMICFFIMIGVAQAMQPIVGYNHGAGKSERVSRTVILAGSICALLGLSFTVLGYFCKDYIVALFTIDEGLREASLNALDLCIYAFAFVGTQIIATQFFQSIGYVRTSFWLSISRQAVFLIPLLLLLPPLYGIDGIWLSLPISDTLAGLLGIGFVLRYFRQEQNRTTKS